MWWQEEELEEEEKARLQQQLHDRSLQEQQQHAATVLLRFIRWIIFQKRFQKLKGNCIHQIEKDLFSAFIITDKMCGICGVGFETASTTAESAPMAPSDADEEEMEDDEEVRVAELKQMHLNSDEHCQMNVNYGIFREMYRSVISGPLIEIGAFLSKHQVRSKTPA